MANLDLDNIYRYHPPLPGQTDKYNEIRETGKRYAETVTRLCPDSRERSVALTNIEQSNMWANAAIARDETVHDIGHFPLISPLSTANMFVTDIAIICHEANRALCFTQFDFSQKSWAEAEGWQKKSAVTGVQFCLDNPNAPASANHESWLAEKIRDGWIYGPEKNPETKEHPCIVSYDELPAAQKAKDHLFKAIVSALAPFLGPMEPPKPVTIFAEPKDAA